MQHKCTGPRAPKKNTMPPPHTHTDNGHAVQCGVGIAFFFQTLGRSFAHHADNKSVTSAVGVCYVDGEYRPYRARRCRSHRGAVVQGRLLHTQPRGQPRERVPIPNDSYVFRVVFNAGRSGTDAIPTAAEISNRSQGV